MAISSDRQPLDRHLLDRGIISTDQLRIAQQEQTHSNLLLGKQLIELGFVSEASLREALSESLGKESVDLTRTIADKEAIAMVPVDFAKRYCLLPLRWYDDTSLLTIACNDVDNIIMLDRLRALLPPHARIETLIAAEGDILQAIDKNYGFELSIDGILKEIETGLSDLHTFGPGNRPEQPIARLVDALLADAVKREASDIHFEPERGFLRVRYRIDGTLRQIRILHHSCWSAMVVRIKVLAGLNIAETRAPQDGRITLNVAGRPIDFRVSTQPTIHGENIVLRILDRHRGLVKLDGLGLSPDQSNALHRMIAHPEGIILFTGPTGSGKTTTLYSILAHINSDAINIMTMEDPVEYPLPRVRQTSVSGAVKLDFADGIRSMMRQDPDVILVGEIRDHETAGMAFRAAMTGHQVYSTLHTNSAVGVIPRLLDLGITPDIMAGNIVGVVAQRLLRRLCPHCARPRPAQPRELPMALNPHEYLPTIHDAVGCEQCDMQGYRGRIAIMELLLIDDDIDELIEQRAGRRQIIICARSKGFRTLAEDGVRRVLAGQTSLQELVRVVNLNDCMPGSRT